MKTKNGIELNLKESEFIFEYKNLKFYFSSKLYLNKFKEQINQFIEMENTKIINKYKVRIDLINYLSVSLYKKIEKRGFLIYDNISNVYITETGSFKDFIIHF